METAQKLQCFARIAQALNDAGVRWALCSSAMLYLRGWTDAFNDFDIETERGGDAAAAAVLGAVGTLENTDVDKLRYDTLTFREYTVGGVDVDLMCEFAVRSEAGIYRYILDDAASELIDVNGVSVPLACGEDWFVLYSLMGRTAKAELLRARLEKQLDHPQLLRRALEQPLPAPLRREIETLLA